MLIILFACCDLKESATETLAFGTLGLSFVALCGASLGAWIVFIQAAVDGACATQPLWESWWRYYVVSSALLSSFYLVYRAASNEVEDDDADDRSTEKSKNTWGFLIKACKWWDSHIYVPILDDPLTFMGLSKVWRADLWNVIDLSSIILLWVVFLWTLAVHGNEVPDELLNYEVCGSVCIHTLGLPQRIHTCIQTSGLQRRTG